MVSVGLATNFKSSRLKERKVGPMGNSQIRSMRMSTVKQFSSDKIYKHLLRVLEWTRGYNPFAVTVEIDPSNKCNHKCPECFGYAGKARDAVMNRSDLFRIIDELKEMGAQGLTFTGGGEPLVNPHTVNAIVYAKEKCRMDVALITNGQLLNKGNVGRLVKACTWIRVSLDAGTPEMHEWTHGIKGGFDIIVNNIKMLVEARRRLHSNCTIGTGYLTSQETMKGMYDYAKLNSELGVDYCQFRPYLKVFSGSNRLIKDGKAVYREIEKCLHLQRPGFNILWSKHKYDHMYDNIKREYDRCYGHQFATVVGADLKMWVCCHMRGIEKYCIGDLNTHSVKEIWSSKQRMEAVSRIDFKDCPLYCRCDGFNKILWRIIEPVQHENFL